MSTNIQTTPGVFRTIVKDPSTGLFYGAIYGLNQTPSGFERLALSGTTMVGLFDPHDAIKAINEIFLPGVPSIGENLFGDLPIPNPKLSLSVGTEIILVTPHDTKEPPYVEFLQNGKYNVTDILPGHLPYLLFLGRIALDTGGFYDPELSACYDTYVVVRQKSLDC